MRRRLVLSYLSVVAVILVLLEIPLGLLTDHHERDVLGVQATQQANVLAVLAGQDLATNDDAGLRSLVTRYHLEATGDVLIVDGAGHAVADSDGDGATDAATLKPSVAAALAGRTVTLETTSGGRAVTLAATAVTDPSVPAGTRTLGVVVLSLYAGKTLQLIHRVWLGLAAFALVALGVTVLIGLRVGRSVTGPLGGLQSAVVRLGDGHLEERVAPAGPPEVRRVGLEFNRMAARMEDLVAAQSLFVADASHQLRSPLTALRLRLESLLADEHGPAADALAPVEREVLRLSRLVDGLLTLSRADGDRPSRSPVDVLDVIHERVETWGPLAAERGVTLSVTPGRVRDPAVDLVPGDLDQVLDNLLANAVDHTPEGRGITVAVVEEARVLDVVVTDEGPGMTEEEQARAFDRFWQGSGHRGGSSGLGLAIVRQLVRRNGGEVDLSTASSVPAANGVAATTSSVPAANGVAVASGASTAGGAAPAGPRSPATGAVGSAPGAGPGLRVRVRLSR